MKNRERIFFKNIVEDFISMGMSIEESIKTAKSTLQLHRNLAKFKGIEIEVLLESEYPLTCGKIEAYGKISSVRNLVGK